MNTTINLSKNEAENLRALLGSMCAAGRSSQAPGPIVSVYEKLNKLVRTDKIEYISPSELSIKLTERKNQESL